MTHFLLFVILFALCIKLPLARRALGVLALLVLALAL
jgi:hypothetical protein